MSESPLTSPQLAQAPRHRRRGRAPHRRALPHADLESRGRRTLRRHHRSGPPADPGLLARPHPDRPLLLPPPRHRRHRQPELRRRVDCAHPRIASATRPRGARRRAAAPGRSCRCAANSRRARRRVHRRRSARPGARGAAGAVLLAGATGQPDPAVSPRGRSFLDDEELGQGADPKPFSTVAVVLGEAVQVSFDEGPAVERCRGELERTLERLEVRATATSSSEPEPRTPNPERRTTNEEPRTKNPTPRTPCTEVERALENPKARARRVLLG